MPSLFWSPHQPGTCHKQGCGQDDGPYDLRFPTTHSVGKEMDPLVQHDVDLPPGSSTLENIGIRPQPLVPQPNRPFAPSV